MTVTHKSFSSRAFNFLPPSPTKITTQLFLQPQHRLPLRHDERSTILLKPTTRHDEQNNTPSPPISSSSSASTSASNTNLSSPISSPDFDLSKTSMYMSFENRNEHHYVLTRDAHIPGSLTGRRGRNSLVVATNLPTSNSSRAPTPDLTGSPFEKDFGNWREEQAATREKAETEE